MRKLGRITLVLMLPVAAAVSSSTSAWARSLPIAKGSVTCTVVAGRAKFSPPLTKSGTSNEETIRFALTVSSCTPADGSKLTSIANRRFHTVMKVPATTDDTANACAKAMPANGSVPAVSVAKWKSRGLAIHLTKLSTTGESWSTAGAHVSVLLPGNGSATNSGTSFAGYDNGANSTISLTLALTGPQYAAVCNPVTGTGRLQKSMVTSGTISIGPTLFSAYTGSARWAAGSDPLVASDTDGKVLDLNSPQTGCASNGYLDCSYAGMTLPGLDGKTLSKVSALSYDFAVQTPGWSGGGGGSPRLVLILSDGGNVQLDPVTSLSTGTWVHMNAISGTVDNSNGTGESCGTYQIAWNTAVSCHGNATIQDAVIVNDSGWAAPSGFDVWVDNLTLNNTVFSQPITAPIS
jgi:hypothetical protein